MAPVRENIGKRQFGVELGFPAPIRLSVRCVAWRESDIAKWQAERGQALGAKP
jgi:predicted DNA-binding transcriptional regulator AlpA